MVGPSSTPLDYFERCYVVNLPDRVDRRRATERELGRVGYPTPAVRWLEAVRAPDAAGFPSAGANGCFHSHLAGLQAAHADGVENVLMLEDDVLVLPALLRVWPSIQRQLDAEPWDLVNLGFDAKEFRDEAPSSPLVRVDRPLTTAHCYAVNRRVLGRLIDFLTAVKGRERGHPQGGRMHYDGALNVFFATYPDVVRLRSSRNLMEQRSSRSDIAEKSWIDRTPMAFGIVEQGRRVKNQLRRRRHAEGSEPAPSSGPPPTP